MQWFQLIQFNVTSEHVELLSWQLKKCTNDFDHLNLSPTRIMQFWADFTFSDLPNPTASWSNIWETANYRSLNVRWKSEKGSLYATKKLIELINLWSQSFITEANIHKTKWPVNLLGRSKWNHFYKSRNIIHLMSLHSLVQINSNTIYFMLYE
jgi:hypothetical protein